MDGGVTPSVDCVALCLDLGFRVLELKRQFYCRGSTVMDRLGMQGDFLFRPGEGAPAWLTVGFS